MYIFVRIHVTIDICYNTGVVDWYFTFFVFDVAFPRPQTKLASFGVISNTLIFLIISP